MGRFKQFSLAIVSVGVLVAVATIASADSGGIEGSSGNDCSAIPTHTFGGTQLDNRWYVYGLEPRTPSNVSVADDKLQVVANKGEVGVTTGGLSLNTKPKYGSYKIHVSDETQIPEGAFASILMWNENSHATIYRSTNSSGGATLDFVWNAAGMTVNGQPVSVVDNASGETKVVNEPMNLAIQVDVPNPDNFQGTAVLKVESVEESHYCENENLSTTTTSQPGTTTTVAAPSTTVEQIPSTSTTTPSQIPINLKSRLYPGWCGAGSSKRAPSSSKQASGSLQSAIDQMAGNGGGVVTFSGVQTISEPLRMKSNVVLRGVDQSATIRTSADMGMMVEFGGAGMSNSVTLSKADAFSKQITANGLQPGIWWIGDENAGGQVVKVLSVDGNQGNLELALAQDFSNFSAKLIKQPIAAAGLENLTLEPRHTVTDLVLIHEAADVWVNNIRTIGSDGKMVDGVHRTSYGQVKAAIALRQTYRASITNNIIFEAKEHGDGGRGYGINISNNTSSSLIEGNKLSKLRHSILLHAGASANVVRNNQSSDALHPNFRPGGPADISFHGYASANLIHKNTVQRIHISDAGKPGPNNTIAFNTFTSGPLTLENKVSHLTLLGNKMDGTLADSFTRLLAKKMPSIAAESTSGNPSPADQPYWKNTGHNPFANGYQGAHGIYEHGSGSGSDIYVDANIDNFNFCG